MRSDWVPLSASALVVGVMALVFGTLLNPESGGGDAADTLSSVANSGGRWLGMSVMYLVASVALALGLPAMLRLFRRRGRRVGVAAVSVFLLGVIGTAGFSMLLVFFRALVKQDAIKQSGIENIGHDPGLGIFLYGWIVAFYLGILLLGIALFVAKQTPLWVPIVLVAFVAALPVSSQFGRVAQVLQVFALAVAFTGIAIAAVAEGEEQSAELTYSQ